MKKGTLNIPTELLKEPEFTKWLASAEARVWMNLVIKIIRKPNDKGYKIPNFVYNTFYTKGKLATSWALSSIAKDLNYGKSGKSNVCKLIKNLEKKNFIKRKHTNIEGTDYTVYELGYINTQQGVEIPYVYDVFTKKFAKQKLDKFA